MAKPDLLNSHIERGCRSDFSSGQESSRRYPPDEDLDGPREQSLSQAVHRAPFRGTMVADSCGAYNVFVNVAGIRSDAF
jgi:hypothetical protein